MPATKHRIQSEAGYPYTDPYLHVEVQYVGHAFIIKRFTMAPSIQSLETEMNKTLLDELEVSIVTGVPLKTLQYWRFTCSSFAPKFIKLVKRVYYRKQELEQWLADKPSFTSATQAKQFSTG